MERYTIFKQHLTKMFFLLINYFLAFQVAVAEAQPGKGSWVSMSKQSSEPQQLGFDKEKIAAVDQMIKTRFKNIKSLIVLKNGQTVIENYYASHADTQISIVHSVTKSVISILVGIALDNGHIRSLDQKVIDFFPEMFSNDTDPLKRDITIRHLLTMSSGFAWNDRGDYFWDWFYSSDFILTSLNLDMQVPPGEKFTYCSPNSHILAGILTRATGMSVLEFANKHLFGPLEIGNIRWVRSPKGYNRGGGGLFLKPRDLAKIGLLYMNRGIWEGERVVSSQWVDLSTTKQVNAYEDFDYGYHWWVKEVNGCQSYRAWGRGGQYIVVIPESSMVIAVTSKTALPLAPTYHYSSLFEEIADSMNKAPCSRVVKKSLVGEKSQVSQPVRTCEHTTEVPEQVTVFLDEYADALMNRDVDRALKYYSKDFLLNGRDIIKTREFLNGVVNGGPVSSFCVALNSFELKGDVAEIKGTTYFNAKPSILIVPRIIYEDGGWRWYGNRKGNKNEDLILPDDVEKFLQEYSQAVARGERKRLEQFFSESFQSRGFTKQTFLDYIMHRFSEVEEYAIELNHFVVNGNTAEVSGLINSKPWGVAPLRFTKMTKEDGRWKWSGN